jgi:hypothetical protein
MRVFISGSAPLSEELFNQFRATTGCAILERYEMPQTIIITSNPYEQELRKPLSVGYSLPRVQIRVIGQTGCQMNPGEVREVCIKGSNVFRVIGKILKKLRNLLLESGSSLEILDIKILKIILDYISLAIRKISLLAMGIMCIRKRLKVVWKSRKQCKKYCLWDTQCGPW